MTTAHQQPTRFEERVYAVVRRIPKGQVRSYRWVAQRLGNPGLARAVGQALKRNPDPQRTPCHRVIRSDGSLGGYAWGAAAKRRRLESERVSVSPAVFGLHVRPDARFTPAWLRSLGALGSLALDAARQGHHARSPLATPAARQPSPLARQ